MGIIVNPDYDVLVQKKGRGYFWENSSSRIGDGNLGLSGGLYFGLFGGRIKQGEKSSEDAFKREVGEEWGEKYGMQIENVRHFLSQPFEEEIPAKKRRGTIDYFAAKFDGNLSKITLNEGAGMVLFSEQEFLGPLRYMIFPPNLEAILKFYRDIKQGAFQI